MKAGGYKSERGMVSALVSALRAESSPWKLQRLTREFDYESGRTDVLALSSDGRLIAFEAKLSDWKKAAHQAWRNTNYVDQTYVVLPYNRISICDAKRDLFARYGVGVCFLGSGRIDLAIPSPSSTPVIQWLNVKAKELLGNYGQGRGAKTRRTDLSGSVAYAY